jgi:hypothetical protein
MNVGVLPELEEKNPKEYETAKNHVRIQNQQSHQQVD